MLKIATGRQASKRLPKQTVAYIWRRIMENYNDKEDVEHIVWLLSGKGLDRLRYVATGLWLQLIKDEIEHRKTLEEGE